jgi:hypothetical protein
VLYATNKISLLRTSKQRFKFQQDSLTCLTQISKQYFVYLLWGEKKQIKNKKSHTQQYTKQKLFKRWSNC